MWKPFIEENSCTGCRECVKVCRGYAIKIFDGKAVIDPERCIGSGCMECMGVCPEGAIRIDENINKCKDCKNKMYCNTCPYNPKPRKKRKEVYRY
ncbi:MAG: DUF362 domain-containing protein [Candidatus Syntropharchaeia archaeon]